MKTLYVHMGAPKTGSSFLQSLLMKNRELLREQGTVYPQCGLMHDTLGTAQHFISFYLEGKKPDWVGKSLLSLEQLQEELLNEDIAGKNVIISSESFFGLPQSENSHKLRKLFPNFDIKLILYLRRPVSFAKSWYSQIVKEPPFYQGTFDDYARYFKYHFEDIIANYASEFGSENMTVFSFESVISDGSLELHFLKETGIQITDDFSYSPSENISPNPSDIELFRRLNAYGSNVVPNNVRSRFYRELAALRSSYKTKLFSSLNTFDDADIPSSLRKNIYDKIGSFVTENEEMFDIFSEQAIKKIEDKYNSSFEEVMKNSFS